MSRCKATHPGLKASDAVAYGFEVILSARCEGAFRVARLTSSTTSAVVASAPITIQAIVVIS